MRPRGKLSAGLSRAARIRATVPRGKRRAAPGLPRSATTGCVADRALLHLQRICSQDLLSIEPRPGLACLPDCPVSRQSCNMNLAILCAVTSGAEWLRVVAHAHPGVVEKRASEVVHRVRQSGGKT